MSNGYIYIYMYKVIKLRLKIKHIRKLNTLKIY